MLLLTTVLGPHLRKHRPGPLKKILRPNNSYAKSPMLLVLDSSPPTPPSGERRTLLLIGRCSVGSRWSKSKRDRLSGACSHQGRDLLLSPPTPRLPAGQHEQPVDASPWPWLLLSLRIGRLPCHMVIFNGMYCFNS